MKFKFMSYFSIMWSIDSSVEPLLLILVCLVAETVYTIAIIYLMYHKCFWDMVIDNLKEIIEGFLYNDHIII